MKSQEATTTPLWACNPVTDATDRCRTLKRNTNDSNGFPNGKNYNCNPASFKKDQYACEESYLANLKCLKKTRNNGGFQRTNLTKDSQRKTFCDNFAMGTSRDFDKHAASNKLLDGRSIMFHCGSPRILCTELENAKHNKKEKISNK
eukprot:Pgem_evm1s17472